MPASGEVKFRPTKGHEGARKEEVRWMDFHTDLLVAATPASPLLAEDAKRRRRCRPQLNSLGIRHSTFVICSGIRVSSFFCICHSSFGISSRKHAEMPNDAGQNNDEIRIPEQMTNVEVPIRNSAFILPSCPFVSLRG
jgi:hypothetical protein